MNATKSERMAPTSVSVKTFVKPIANPNLLHDKKVFNARNNTVARKQVNNARVKLA